MALSATLYTKPRALCRSSLDKRGAYLLTKSVAKPTKYLTRRWTLSAALMSEGPIDAGLELINSEVSLVMLDMKVAPCLVVKHTVLKSLAKLCLSKRPVKS